jgi:hypothetical protein
MYFMLVTWWKNRSTRYANLLRLAVEKVINNRTSSHCQSDFYVVYCGMTNNQKKALRIMFDANPSASVLEWMVATPALDNNEVWDVYEEWQDEDPLPTA